jgi:hypothetical protein
MQGIAAFVLSVSSSYADYTGYKKGSAFWHLPFISNDISYGA